MHRSDPYGNLWAQADQAERSAKFAFRLAIAAAVLSVIGAGLRIAAMVVDEPTTTTTTSIYTGGSG